MRSLSRLMAALAAMSACATLSAAPLALEEQARLVPPDSRYTHVSEVAVDGNRAVISAWREGPAGNDFILAAFLFERSSAGKWTSVATLLLDQPGSFLGEPDPVSVAVQGDVAAISWLGNLRIFERRSTGWVNTGTIRNPPNVAAMGRDVEIDGGTVIVSGEGPQMQVLAYRRNASGQWVQDGVMVAGPTRNVVHGHGGDTDIIGNQVFFGIPFEEELNNAPELASWLRTTSGWGNRGSFSLADLADPRALAFDGGTVLVNSPVWAGILKLKLAAGNLVPDGVRLQSADAFMLNRDGRTFASTFDIGSLAAAGGLGVVGMFGDDLRGEDAGSVHVYDIGANGGARPIARLLSSDASVQQFLGKTVEISGRRVIASGDHAAYIYDVPVDLSQPVVILDDFETGNASQWTPLAGSSFSVVPSNSTLVYRQSSVAGDAAASRTGLDWSNQAIEADARPTAFSASGERWFGLTVRQTDTGNFYYVTLRTTNRIEVRKLQNGSISVLASAPFPVTLNRTYRLRLEAVGTWIRAYVDGKLFVQARDSVHKRGTAGVRMYKAAVDYDNVTITPNPQVTLFANDFEEDVPFEWTSVMGGYTHVQDGSRVVEQTSTSGDARLIAGTDTGDQVVQMRAKAVTFNGADRWFGPVARYADDYNFYYMTVRSSNQVSLRKLTGANVTVLDSAPLPVTTNTWYTLRLEAVGNSLRGYVNGRLVVEARDSSIAAGRYGMAMYKTAARFDDLLALEP
ncbi:MAG TPA: hypothetical protein VFS52_09855 [Steroidobacteraceae bacterium]|nr:hypothetical protein [Steroidobacteraceae bacterium]